MEKGNIVDTLYFGTFTKASTIQGDAGNFVYCPGPKAALKLIENVDSAIDIPQALLDEKLVTLSTTQLADECRTTVETVNSFLSGIRDEVVDLVVNKKQNATLNFGFGTLSLRHGGTVEFKSSFSQTIETDYDKLP